MGGEFTYPGSHWFSQPPAYLTSQAPNQLKPHRWLTQEGPVLKTEAQPRGTTRNDPQEPHSLRIGGGHVPRKAHWDRRPHEVLSIA